MNTLPSSVCRAALVTVVAVATACGGGGGSSSGGDASSAATYPLVLVVGGENVGTATFDGTNWMPLAPIAMAPPRSDVGGITMLHDGRPLVAALPLPTAPGTPWSATLTGTTWSTPTTFAMNAGFGLSIPATTDTGAVVVVDENSVSGTLHLATFDGTSSTWTSDENTGVGAGPPAVVVPSRTGSDLFVLGWSQTHANQYAWSRRTQGTWSPPVDVPAPIGCMSDCFTADIAAVRRGGTDAIVAAFAGTPDEPPLLRAATFSGGTWSPSVTLATNGAVANRALAITALRDGRVALAYLSPDGGVWVGFFDGTTWGPFRAIGAGVTAAVDFAAVPVALAPGRDSRAVLELVFVEMHTIAVRHVRLLDASTWTWSPPVTVGAMSGGAVGLATTPVP